MSQLGGPGYPEYDPLSQRLEEEINWYEVLNDEKRLLAMTASEWAKAPWTRRDFVMRLGGAIKRYIKLSMELRDQLNVERRASEIVAGALKDNNLFLTRRNDGERQQ